MTQTISPELDAYGTYARASALADWLELAAWQGRRVTRAQLEDLIYDNNWTTKRPQQFLMVEQPAHSENEDADFYPEVPELWSEAVLALLQERADLLKDAWPFQIEGDWQLVAKDDLSQDCPYLALLCMTVAHAWKLRTSTNATILIEETVSRALSSKGWHVISMGTGDRSGLSFQDNLASAATELGLPILDPALPAKLHAKDGGVDTLTFIGWSDCRLAGQWLSIGQVTIMKSDGWHMKIGEPRPDHWAKYFLQPLLPARFLAVPHHVEKYHLEYLVGSDTGAVIDRLRLTMSLAETTERERQLVREVFECQVDDGRSIR